MKTADEARAMELVTWGLVETGVMTEGQRAKAIALLADKHRQWAEEARQQSKAQFEEFEAERKRKEEENRRQHPPVEPTHPRSIRCLFGLHGEMAEVAEPLPFSPNATRRVCVRCGQPQMGI